MKNKKLFAILTLVCFMFTLMPVAAFADAVDPATSGVIVKDGEKTTLTDAAEKTVLQVIEKDNAANKADSVNKNLYVWATDAAGNITSALAEATVEGATKESACGIAYVNEYTVTATDGVRDITVKFARAGEYSVHVGLGVADAKSLNDIIEISGAKAPVITLVGSANNPENYRLEIGAIKFYPAVANELGNVQPNNVANQYTLSFYEKIAEGVAKDLVGKTVTLQADSSNITVTPESATTDFQGNVKINLAASREGKYTIYANVDGAIFPIVVNCTNNDAAYIETVEQPAAPLAQFTTAADFVDEVVFYVTDINGNAVQTLGDGAKNITNQNGATEKAKYLFFVEKPAATKLNNADLSLQPADSNGEYYLDLNNKPLDAEGIYTVKAILDNGSVATATWEVKKFQTPVKINIKAPTTVELGKSVGVALEYEDANGVTKKANDAKLAATGYAISKFSTGIASGSVNVKTDEKYAGSTITLTAVSEMYDLVATTDVKVAAEAVAIAFAKDALDVNVNNKVAWNVVDAEGNVVKLTKTAVDVKYVVLDKPEGAKVSVYDRTGLEDFDGDGVMALTSDKVGNVVVQVIAQVQFGTNETEGTAVNTNTAQQTKYYTGTQVFAVGTEGVGDVVVMSIGSNEIVINDAKATIDAAPIVENNRTFVPFRALAEAFGATVAFDEATQAVTAVLNGVTVVMTIGSAEYTENGVANTADVAPFINGSRTMIPVRFAAEAFGITVTPTYDDNGATADVLFAK